LNNSTKLKDRTMRLLLATVGACGIAVGMAVASGEPVAPTPAAPASPSTSELRALVEKLGAERYSDREAAAAALEKIGAPAIEALAGAANSDSPEVRERAGAMLVKLRRIAESGNRLVAKRVKLDYKDIPLGTAFNDLKAATGLNITLDPSRIENPLRRVTCKTAELPVWEALDAFCIAAGLREAFVADLAVPKPRNFGRGGYVPPPQIPDADTVPVLLIDGKPQKLPGDRATAVRVLVLPPSFAGHKVTLGTGEISLCLDVTPAPGLNWQDVTGVKISRLIDSAGRVGGAGIEKPATPGNQDPNGMVVFARPGGIGMMRFDANGNAISPDTVPNPRILSVPLKLNSLSSRSLKRLEGSIFGEVQVPNQPLITVVDPKKHVNSAFNGPGELRFTVLDVKEAPGTGGLGTVRVQIESPSAWVVNARKRGWNPGWPEAPRMTVGNRVEAFDAAGKPFPLAMNGYSDMSDDGMTTIATMTMTFRPGIGLPAKLVVVGPKTVTVEVPFALEDVPLP
jgi:hypothetical protein